MIWFLLAVFALSAIGIAIFLNSPSFGKLPSGARLERIKQSPNYRDGKFQNQEPTTLLTNGKSRMQSLWEFFFLKVNDLVPSQDVSAVKTDLKALSLNEDLIVWMGHSSLYIQLGGKRILVDPVLVSASPVSFINKPFRGTSIYRPDDMPPVDILLITHDHWDHLDYATVLALKNNIGQIVCPLGVGEHFAYWGFSPEIIHELDWYESANLTEEILLTSVPARHFSGRGLTSNQTLWTGYMLQHSAGNILLSGDTGYGKHIKAIKEKFGTIDFAILENGQYNEDWRYIHMVPDDLIQAINELGPRRLMTVHHSKYALARHAWNEPMEKIASAAENLGFPLVTPKIGDVVRLRDTVQTFQTWWN